MRDLLKHVSCEQDKLFNVARIRYMKDNKYRIYIVVIRVRELIAKLLYILFYIDNPYAAYNRQAN